MRIILWGFLLLSFSMVAQNDLLEELEQDSVTSQPTQAVFKGLKIINLESTKLVSKGNFYFIVAHRFGNVKTGIEDFFGLDNAVTRLQFIYGICDGLNIGVSRSSLAKTYDMAVKYRVLQQNDSNMPVTVVGYNMVVMNTGLDEDLLPLLEFKHRLSYVAQVLVSRKFTDNLSLELAPSFFHDNYVAINDQDNSQFAIGVGGRYKITKRVSLNIDYAAHLNRASNSPYKNPLSIGADIETGGHVFQLHFTNAQQMTENGFLGQAVGDWSDGSFYFGFNLSRVF